VSLSFNILSRWKIFFLYSFTGFFR